MHVVRAHRVPGMLLALAAHAAPAAFAQEQAPAPAPKDPCSAEEFRAFDFWVGRWQVRDASGKLAGTNVITSEENGCVIVEHWTSAQGRTGQSLNYYDPLAKGWKQRWVGLGLLLEMDGGVKDGAITLEGPLQYLGTPRVTRLRGIWTRLADGRVRQQFLESSDDGKTWTEWFDGYYTRIAADPKPQARP